MSIVIRNKHCTFAYKCDLQWDGLRETKDPNARYCDKCKNLVYWCASEAELIQSITLNRCVAFEVIKAGEEKKQFHRLMGHIIFDESSKDTSF